MNKNEIKQQGLKAQAEVLNVKDTGGNMGNLYFQLRLKLKVMPKESEPFIIEAKAYFPRLEIPKKGDVIPVKYLPTDHSQIIIIANGVID